jgi:phosphonate transport system permease protein
MINPQKVILHSKSHHARSGLTLIRISILAMIALVFGSWLFVFESDQVQTQPFFSEETLNRIGVFIKELFGIGSERTPAFLRWVEWQYAAKLAYQTLVMSVLGIGLAAMIAIATFMFGASNIMMGSLAPYGSWIWRGLFLIVRGLFIVSRAIPELIWAMLIVFVLSPGLLPGAVALGLHNAGILGKLASEVVEGLDPRPIQALRSSGAGRLQIMAYGVFPQAMPRFITYLFYRWEVIIRTTIVVGFVAAGGLGLEFRLSMSYFHYTTITLLLGWYLLLVIGVDLVSGYLRRLAR